MKEVPNTDGVQYYDKAKPILHHFDIIPVETIESIGLKKPLSAPCVLFGVFSKISGERVDGWYLTEDENIDNYYVDGEGRVTADCYYWIYTHGPSYIKYLEEEIESIIFHE
jgi:hypothetical protein